MNQVWRTFTKVIPKEKTLVATNENCILRKMGLKFHNPGFNLLCKIAFWNKQKWLNKELIIWSGLREKDSLFDWTASKNDQVYLQENFWLDGTKSACVHYPQPTQ